MNGPTPLTATDDAVPLLVLIPIYNDWDAASRLVEALDRALAGHQLAARVLLVNDGSTEPVGLALPARGYTAIGRVDVLGLRSNLGHQRAIAIALAYVHDRIKPAAVLIMDGDGEDAPDDVPRLLARLSETGYDKVVFAERRRRSEGFTFRVFYALFRIAHRLMTGIPVRVGNFSVVPGPLVGRLVVVGELWNHYAAAVFKARLPRETIPTVRGRRLGGRSQMNFMALAGHGLSALSVHAELIGVRLLVTTVVLVAVLGVALGAVLAARVLTPFALPAWAATATALLLVVLFQTIALAGLFVFLVLHARSQPLFIPLRDYPYFVAELVQTFPAEGASLMAARQDADLPAVPPSRR